MILSSLVTWCIEKTPGAFKRLLMLFAVWTIPAFVCQVQSGCFLSREDIFFLILFRIGFQINRWLLVFSVTCKFIWQEGSISTSMTSGPPQQSMPHHASTTQQLLFLAVHGGDIEACKHCLCMPATARRPVHMIALSPWRRGHGSLKPGCQLLHMIHDSSVSMHAMEKRRLGIWVSWESFQGLHGDAPAWCDAASLLAADFSAVSRSE